MSSYLILTMAVAFMFANLWGAWLTIKRLHAKRIRQPANQYAGMPPGSDASTDIAINFGFVRLQAGSFGLFAVPALIAIAFIALGVAVHQLW